MCKTNVFALIYCDFLRMVSLNDLAGASPDYGKNVSPCTFQFGCVRELLDFVACLALVLALMIVTSIK